MNWKNPNAELHATGWVAIFLVSALIIASIGGIARMIGWFL